MKIKYKTHCSRAIVFFILCLLLFSLTGCMTEPQNGVFLLEPDDNYYTPVAISILPYDEIKPLRDGIFWHLETGAVTEGNDAHAYSALKSGLAAHWYPHFLSTAIIAVDRDQTAASISGWSDLSDIDETVGIYEGNYGIGADMLISAMSYGLEGDGYSLKTALYLLENLNNTGRLKKNDFDLPIMICFDDQAARLISEGRNLEIIIPAEGTFTYQKGLLSSEPLNFSGDVEQALLSAGLRLLDGRCDEALYPAAVAYETADKITEMEHYLTVELESVRSLRRDVWHERLYTGADGREHQIFALMYIVLISIWTASVIRRAMQKSVQRGALASCIILLAWITVRLIKYQTDSHIYWDRFLWFSYLGFQLLLMFTLLAMAWNVDLKPGRNSMPKWLWALGTMNLLLALLVLTNDLHGWVYIIDYSNPFWRDDYGYDIGYNLITVLYMTEFVVANVLLLMKSVRNPNKKGLFFPLALCVLIFVYRLGYIARIPLMRESDMTMVTGVFVLLFFESAIQAGMIPVNTKYTTVFSRSTLRMQILGPDGTVALAPISAEPLNQQARDYVLSGNLQPFLPDENTLIYRGTVTGGYVAWQEDISGLNHLHRETEESVHRIRAANALLSEEAKINQQFNEKAAKRQLTEQLEIEIAEKTAQLTCMIDALDESENQAHETTRIALLLCYIKRRCNLFFRERETERIQSEELTMYLDELAELAGHTGVNIAPVCQLKDDLPVRNATLFYDMFYETVAWAAEHSCKTMLVHLGMERGTVTMRLTPSADIRGYSFGKRFEEAIKLAAGTVLVKDLGDTTGISLSFPESPVVMGGGYVDA